jgi:hypothetical protein
MSIAKQPRRQNAETRIQRHPAAVAVDEWEAKNADLFRRATLGTDPKYLRNRLRHAFMDGWEARQRDSASGDA